MGTVNKERRSNKDRRQYTYTAYVIDRRKYDRRKK